MKTIFVAALFAASLFAQEPTPGKRVLIQDEVHEVGGVAARRFVFSTGPQTVEFVSGATVGPMVTKAPYAAEAVTESIQTLYDGNRIVQRESTKQYRDSEGRERREEGAPFNVVFITDPVAKASYTLHPESKTAEKLPGAPGTLDIITAHAPVTGGAITTMRVGAPAANQFFYVGAGAERMAAPTAREEDLGTRMIEGVEAKGTRTTTTIAAGEIGNDRPIDVVDERWYSPELQLTVLTRHADPRMGENIYKLINIQRIEQVRSLFEVPPGYTLHEGGFGKMLKIEE